MPVPAPTTPHTRSSAKERVFQTLQDWIVDGTLLPGEKINDAELSQYFNVSRTPVREALQLLAEKKLVDVVPACGTYVASVEKKDFIQIYEALAGIYSYGLALAYPKMDKKDFAEYRALNHQFKQAIGTGEYKRMRQADRVFHRAMLQKSGNEYLLRFAEELDLHTYRAENVFFKRGMEAMQSWAFHERIISTLEKGDLPHAQEATIANWLTTLEVFQ